MKILSIVIIFLVMSYQASMGLNGNESTSGETQAERIDYCINSGGGGGSQGPKRPK